MKRFTMWFTKLPICGKNVYKYNAMRVMASQNAAERLTTTLKMYGLMLFIDVCLFGQLIMGIEFCIKAPWFAKVMGLFYALVNGGAIVTHLSLGYRVYHFIARDKFYRPREVWCERGKWSDIGITLLVQLIFLLCYETWC